MLTTLLLSFAFAPVPDTILINGKIWTGDAVLPEAAALAIANGSILKVGTKEEIKALAGPNTKTIDLKDRRVLPGFHDSHVHLLGGGRALAQVSLKDAKDEAEFGKRLREYDEKLPKGRWLLGGGWDHERTFAGVLPTAELIDKYVKDRPVFLRRYDGHMAVANSKALAMAGISSDTKDPPGGVIGRGADGKAPNGWLKDNAMGVMDKIVPEPDETEIREAVLAAFKAFAANGITSATDMDGSAAATSRKYRNHLMQFGEKLTVRLDLHSQSPIADLVQSIRDGNDLKSDFITQRGFKGFMDGSLGSSTAKMAEPYDSDMTTTGVFVTEPGTMKTLVRQADSPGLSVAVHAIGDEANHQLLNIYNEVAEINGPRDRRFRIEHAQHLRASDIPRFKELNVIASMQPYHCIEDGVWAEGRIGAKRCETSYAFRSLLDSGAVLAFGSDWPVAPLDVLGGIDAAVNRRTIDGKHPDGWFPKQRITVAEAVKAYTWGGAYVSFRDKNCGTLTAGKVADIVVLSRDIFDAKEKDDIAKVKVDMTMVNGKIVFERK